MTCNYNGHLESQGIWNEQLNTCIYQYRDRSVDEQTALFIEQKEREQRVNSILTLYDVGTTVIYTLLAVCIVYFVISKLKNDNRKNC